MLDLLFPGTVKEEVEIHIPMTPLCEARHPPMRSCYLINLALLLYSKSLAYGEGLAGRRIKSVSNFSYFIAKD